MTRYAPGTDPAYIRQQEALFQQFLRNRASQKPTAQPEYGSYGPDDVGNGPSYTLTPIEGGFDNSVRTPADTWRAMTPQQRADARRAQQGRVDKAQKLRADTIAKRNAANAALVKKNTAIREKTRLQRQNAAATRAQQQRVAAAARQRTQKTARDAAIRERSAVTQKRLADAAKLRTQTRNRAAQAATARNRAIANQRAANLRRSNEQIGRQGLAGAENFFRDRGVDPGGFRGNIQSAIQRVLGGLKPDEAANIGMFENLGEDVFNQIQDRGRTAATGQVNRLFQPNFETTNIDDAFDDAIIGTLEGEQYNEAKNYLDNLLNRGVINNTGYQAGLGNIDKQRGSVRLQLQDIGNDILAGGRQQLTDIGNRARTAASNLGVGQVFDAQPFAASMSKALESFRSTLDPAFRTQIGAGKNLFDTSKLANIAGMAQGAGNMRFDPNALAGRPTPENPFGFEVSEMDSVF